MLKKVNNKGFSIIEVLIVLAIAGLIMLVVFLAVPALRLNSANSARQNDASRISSAVTDCLSNRNGVIASCQTFKDPDLAATAGNQIEVGQLSQLQVGATPANPCAATSSTYCTVTVSSTPATQATQITTANTWVTTSNTDATRWYVAYNAKCNQDGSAFVYSSNQRDFAILYGKGVRTGTPVPVCIGS